MKTTRVCDTSMPTNLQTHTTTIELSEPLPVEVAVGSNLTLKVKVSCSAGCDLRGLPVTVAGTNGVVATSALAACDAAVNESGDIIVKAPVRVGTHTWTMAFE